MEVGKGGGMEGESESGTDELADRGREKGKEGRNGGREEEKENGRGREEGMAGGWEGERERKGQLYTGRNRFGSLASTRTKVESNSSDKRRKESLCRLQHVALRYSVPRALRRDTTSKGTHRPRLVARSSRDCSGRALQPCRSDSASVGGPGWVGAIKGKRRDRHVCRRAEKRPASLPR